MKALRAAITRLFGFLQSDRRERGALMRGLLIDTAPWDVTTLTGVAAVLGVAALLASFLPARRAASVDPIEALRSE